jgi:hypothetical protein
MSPSEFQAALTRRAFLGRTAQGVGGVALASLLGPAASGAPGVLSRLPLPQKAKRIIWLNPEGRALWGTGDSVIPRYEPFCAQMSHVATLKDLEKAIDEVLTAYS